MVNIVVGQTHAMQERALTLESVWHSIGKGPAYAASQLIGFKEQACATLDLSFFMHLLLPPCRFDCLQISSLGTHQSFLLHQHEFLAPTRPVSKLQLALHESRFLLQLAIYDCRIYAGYRDILLRWPIASNPSNSQEVPGRFSGRRRSVRQASEDWRARR